MQRRTCVFLLIVLLVVAPHQAAAEEIMIGAASDLAFAIRDLVAGFAQATRHTARFSTSASGNLYAQIQNGAPFDLFFSADVDYPRRLEAAGFVEPGSLYIYAIGKVVVWVRNDSPLDVNTGWAALLDPRARRIAVANPETAPYGRAAVAALRSAGIYDRVASRLVYGENISQAAQFVESGSADAGVLSLSFTAADTMRGRGRWWVVPVESYPRLEQAAVVLRSSQKKAAARAFMDYMRSAEARAVLERHGFNLPAANQRP
jgi:molybdate transport system substrate-binding protein